MSLLQNTIEVRGVNYTVVELSGKHMAKVRQFLGDEKWKTDPYIAQACCIDPKLSAADVDTLPHFVIDAISTEVFRLSKLPAPGND